MCSSRYKSGSESRNISASTFSNPIIQEPAGDPWIIKDGDFYYFTGTFDQQQGISIWKSMSLINWTQAEKSRVWVAPSSGPGSKQIWAPELHRIDGAWYLYYTASDGIDANHRHYVMRALSDDPLEEYTEPKLLYPEYDRYAIDGSVLRLANGDLFWMFCDQGLRIARMESPELARGTSACFLEGRHEWERAWIFENSRWNKAPSYWVEAPQALYRDGRIFVTYSAGHTGTPHYYVGLLEFTGTDPANPDHWNRWDEPILKPMHGTERSVFTTGHNSFTVSPDGTEDWIVYHGKDFGMEVPSPRTVRIQRLYWGKDGIPFIGDAVPAGIPLEAPGV